MNVYSKILKNEKLYIILFWIIYTLLCVHFYVERSTFADNSYYLFNIIQQQKFCIQYDRYFAVFTQWLPLLAVKLKLSLNAILYAHSLCPIILNISLFLLIRYLSTEKWISYVYLLAISTALHDAFFYVNDEMAQASSLLLLIPTILRTKKWNETYKTIALMLLILLLHLAHLFLLLTALIILCIMLLEKRQRSMILGIVIVVIPILIKAVFFKSGRDGDSIDALSWHAITIKNLYASVFAKFFIYSVPKFYVFTIGFMLVLLLRVSIKKISLLALFSASIGLYILMVVFIRSDVTTNAYMDRYLSIIIMIGWTVVAFVISKNNIENPLYKLALMLTIGMAFAQLYAEPAYTKRIEFLSTLMKHKPNKQIYLYEEMPDVIKKITWSIPYETLLISSLEGESKTILFQENHFNLDNYLADETYFLGAPWTFKHPTLLNPFYFSLKNARYVYQKGLILR